MQTLEGTPALVHAARAEIMQGLRAKTLTFGVGFLGSLGAPVRGILGVWSFMSMWSYMWGHLSANMGHNYSYPPL